MFRSKKEGAPKDEIFDIDLDHGIIKRKSDGVRVLALGSAGWATLEKELTSTFISGAAVILQRMGYSYGRYLGRVEKAREKTPQETMDSIASYAKESGWGELVLNGGDLYAGQARLLLRNCIFCVHIKEASEPVCYMLSGLIGGISDEMIGGTHRVLEERCVGKGDPHCEVVVERVG